MNDFVSSFLSLHEKVSLAVGFEYNLEILKDKIKNLLKCLPYSHDFATLSIMAKPSFTNTLPAICLSQCLPCIHTLSKGVPGGPSGPSREGPGVGHKIVSDTKQMTKKREKKRKK